MSSEDAEWKAEELSRQKESQERLQDQVYNAERNSESDVSWVKKRLLNDIPFWFEFWWNMDLSHKQVGMLNSYDTERHTIFISSRQVGKTTAGGGSLARTAILSPGTQSGIYAPSFNQAISLGFGNVKMFLEAQPLLDAQIAQTYKSGKIIMHNGSIVLAQTANKESNIRGFSPDKIWIDESALIDDETYSADILGSGAAVKGLKMHGGIPRTTKILETSTPFGRNHFWKSIRPLPVFEYGLLDEDTANITFMPSEAVENVRTMADTVHNVNVFYCPWWESKLIHSDRYIIDLDWVAKRMREDPRRLFEQEYCCAFNSDEGFAFNLQQIYKQCTITERIAVRDKNAVYCAGIDLGINQDHSVLSVFKVDPQDGLRVMVFQYEWDLKDEWRDVYHDSKEMLAFWNPELTLVDATGLGEPIYDAEYKRTRFRTEGIIYGRKTKMELMRNLEKRLENGSVVMWKDRELIKQLKELPIKLMEGYVKYPKPEGGHDDRVQSVALALLACNKYLGDDRRRIGAKMWEKPGSSEFRSWLDDEVNADESHNWADGSPGSKRKQGAKIGHGGKGGRVER